MASLDRKLVVSLGLLPQAKQFTKAATAAGLKVPSRFGTEVVARLLGLRINHPAAQDYLELRPQDTATRAEAAYSAAQILGFGYLADSWQIAEVKQLAATISLPTLTPWQQQILHVARLEDRDAVRLGRNERRRPRRRSASTARGGYDCSGFVWRVYKLQSYPDEGNLASVIQGRTTYDDERRGAAVEADHVREAPARRRHLLRRQRPALVGQRRSSTRASTSATAGSSTRPTRASRSRSSPAGTARSSRGAAGRSARPASSSDARPLSHRANRGQLPPSGDSSTSRSHTQSVLPGVLEPIPWRKEMLEFKSRFVVLAVVAAAAVAAVLGNYGWIKPPSLAAPHNL